MEEEKMYTLEEVRDKVRAAIEHRATWMALMYLEMKKAGVANAEQITRSAISQTGEMHGKAMRAAIENPEDIRRFKEHFMHPVNRALFGVDVVKNMPEELELEFGYCALVEGWKKLGVEQETLELLCDMAMDGDRGIARGMGYDFELGDTIAKRGCNSCQMRYFHEK